MAGRYILTLCLVTNVICTVCGGNCLAEFDKYKANSFLKSTRRECCMEKPCEDVRYGCNNREFQSFISATQNYHCNPGQIVRVTSFCVNHFHYECINVCDENVFPVCRNGGTCIPIGTSYLCKCQFGFSGATCEEDIDECHSHICSVNQTERCVNTHGSYICTCKAGYFGRNCETDINECLIPACHVTQTQSCDNIPGSYSCTCIPGYTGRNCQTEINECASSPCQNGAICHDLVNMYSCECIGRFYGDNCETNTPTTTQAGNNDVSTVAPSEINECASSPCQNGAICHDLVNMYRCECVGRFYGVNCETNTPTTTQAGNNDVSTVAPSELIIHEKKTATALIVGLSIASVVLAVVGAVIGIFIVRNHRRKNQHPGITDPVPNYYNVPSNSIAQLNGTASDSSVPTEYINANINTYESLTPQNQRVDDCHYDSITRDDNTTNSNTAIYTDLSETNEAANYEELQRTGTDEHVYKSLSK